MIVKARATASGTEYWDNIKKKTIHVPTGETPGFDFIENPESWLDKEIVKEDIQELEHEEIDYNAMTVKQLIDLAKDNDVDLGNAKKKTDIVKALMDNE